MTKQEKIERLADLLMGSFDLSRFEIAIKNLEKGHEIFSGRQDCEIYYADIHTGDL